MIEQNENSIEEKEREWAKLNPACIVCGSNNPKGLQINFQQQANAAYAVWTPASDWESFQGTIHGGILSTVLDEAMSKAIIASGWEAFTVDLNVRFKKHVSPGEELHIRGWVIEKKRRRILAEATLTTVSGVECVHAKGTFLVPPQD